MNVMKSYDPIDMTAKNSSANIQNQSIYASQEVDGRRVQIAQLNGFEPKGSAQILNRYTPFLFDWDKARKDAGIRPLQPDDL